MHTTETHTSNSLTCGLVILYAMMVINYLCFSKYLYIHYVIKQFFVIYIHVCHNDIKAVFCYN